MKTQIKNLKEFKALIERYESITLKEIIESNCAKRTLTGLGSNTTCTLCQVAGYIPDSEKEDTCIYCVYSLTTPIPEIGVPCNSGDNMSTYDAMFYADTPKQLLKAYRNRAKHMRKIKAKLNLE